MASNYTRYIEFKVKGRELTQAVDKIFKGVTKIEISVEKQGKKWEKVRQGLSYVSKEVKQVNKELNNTQKALSRIVSLKKKLSDPQGLAKSLVSGGFGAILNNPGKIAKAIAKLGVADAAVRTLNGRTKGLGQTLLDLGKKVTSARTALEGYSQTLDRLIRQHPQATAGIIGFAGGLSAVVAYAPQVYNLGKSFRQLTADIMAVDKAGREGGLKNILRLFPKGSILGGLGRAGDIDKLKIPKDLEKSAEKVAFKYKQAATGLTKLREQLEKSKRIQDKLLAGSDRYLKIAKNTLNIEKQITKEEQRRERINRRLTWGKDLMKALGGQMGIAKLGAGAAGGIAGLIGLDQAIRKISDALGQQVGLYKAVTKGSSAFFSGLQAIKKAAGGALVSLDNYARQIVNIVATHQRLIQSTVGVIGGLDAVGRFTPQIYAAGAAWRQLEYDIRRVGKAFKESGFRGVAKLFPKGSYIGKWGRENEEEFAGDKAYKGIQKEWRKMGEHPGDLRSQVDGLSKVNRILENNKKIQENINAFSMKHVQATVAVRKAQTAVNHELLRAKLTQAAFTADIWAAKKAWSGLTGIIKGATGVLGGLLGGKAGKLGQAAAVVGISDAVSKLIKFVPLLDEAWKKNIQTFATWTKTATEGITAVGLAYTGLNATLSAANWVTGAVQGFVEFEKQAARSIWQLEKRWRGLEGVLAAVMMSGINPFGEGGAWNLGNMWKQGLSGRTEEKRGVVEGDSETQWLEKQIAEQTKALQARNVTAADYQKIQKNILTQEKLLTEEVNKRRRAKVQAGADPNEVFKEELQAVDDALEAQFELRDKAAQRQGDIETKRVQQRIAEDEKANKIALAAKQKIYDAETRAWDLRMKQKEKERAAEARYQQQLKKRKQARGEMMGRLGENLMLGAGFPLLFGGGAGAVGGGVIGAGLQAVSGSKGFGMQILFSALGQQVDAFMGEVSKVGQALNSLEKDATPLVERLGVTGTEFERQIKLLEQLGDKEGAFALAREEMLRLVGDKGINDLAQYGKETQELGNAWNKVMTQMGAGIAGLITASGILKSLIAGLNRQAVINQAIANVGGDQKLSDINSQIARYSTGEIRPGNRDFPSLPDLTQQLFERQTQLNMGDADRARKGMADALNKAATSDLDKKKLLLEETFRMGEKYAGIEEKIRELKDKNKDLDEGAYRAKARALIAQEALLDNYQRIGETIKNGMVDAIDSAIEGTKTLGEVASSVFRQIARMMIQFGVNQAFGPAGLNWLPGRAAGGPVTGGNSYLVGEKGPEIFTPGKSGSITPNNQLGGTSNVTINVDAGGSSMQGDAEQAGQLGRMLAAAVQDEMARQKRPGGILY